ncbi:EAL domain-containing protein [Lysinibacillus yapensis]|uniref:EAL domain-containing protein n=1 Tax=Ureibacillus yapensis TaxID=2304605 RepID=A0A396SDW2_9BACL|nr:EAL domain-containing protein [Lysinibacillus yapensis]RHW36176.1 EAL domain-containing protein [Lysinibacillus yapensis]
MFSIPNSQEITILQENYSVALVILSIVIACCASYTALFLNQRIEENGFFPKIFWLFLSSLAMGLGIWSMHFIGMSALELPVAMKYNNFLTILSIIVAVIASYIALYFANSSNQRRFSFLLVGVVMGLGIAAMHYLGMKAMETEARYYYEPWSFVLSIAIAIVVSNIAMYIFLFFKKNKSNSWIKIVTAILMGLAISSMHYTGMVSVKFYVQGTQPEAHGMSIHHMDSAFIILVAAGIFNLFIIAGLMSLLDRYVDYRLNHYDALTLFPNQRQFEKDTNYLETTGSLAIFQIQNLENLTNQYGYLFGDKVVKAVSERIIRKKMNHFKVYRVEGNRLAIFSSNHKDYGALKALVERVTEGLKQPIEIEPYSIAMETICAISTSEKLTVRELLMNNLAVLQHSRNEFESTVIEFDPKVHTYNVERQLIEDIDRAMKNDELFLVYQPKIQTHSEKVSGLEALVRWHHPVNGMIPPGVFIPVIESAGGKIFDVTDWIIKKVCQQIAGWIKEGIEFEQVAINIPGSYITSCRLFDVITANLVHYNIPTRHIELEITETSVVYDIKNAITAINRFREIGLSVALDDFGTGLSSLSHLKKMPISTIKIDKSFVDGIPCSEKDSAVLRSIVALSSSLNLKIVIEGVETEEQYNFLSAMKEAPLIQGYYFSKPLKAKDYIDWTKQRMVPN